MNKICSIPNCVNTKLGIWNILIYFLGKEKFFVSKIEKIKLFKMSLDKSPKRLIKKILVYYDVTQKSFTKRNLIFCVDINHKRHNSSLFKTFRPFKESNNLLKTREISNLRFSESFQRSDQT